LASALTVMSVLLACEVASAAQAPATIAIDREWDVLRKPSRNPGRRSLLLQAGELLGDWTINLAGQEITGEDLVTLSQTPQHESITRAVREYVRRPVDLDDFLYFLDDLLAKGESLRGRTIWLPGGRARAAGILLHPSDVFRKNRPRLYAVRYSELSLDKPQRPANLEPAADGDLLGPTWSARFPNPDNQAARLTALQDRSPSRTFHSRLVSLIEQLREQGADVFVDSTVRFRERGYLMWGAFLLSRAKDERAVNKTVRMLDQTNEDWDLNIPITWKHPGGWKATVEAATDMAEAYDVVFATRRGAMKSEHYDGVAIDFTAVGLPSELTMTAPDGDTRTFDLSDWNQPRDLSLTRELIAWIEVHFQMRKLLRDYPHWSDAAEPATEKEAPATQVAGVGHNEPTSLRE
jgi:hypothetical protein